MMTHVRYALVMPAASERQAARTDEARDVEAVRNARWYLAGLAGSLLGNSAMSLVAGVWVKALTGSSSQAGVVSACVYAGTMGAPFAGLIADRFSRRRLLFWLNLLSASTVLPLLLVSDRARVWLVFAVMAVYGLQATAMDPAEDALFAEMFSVEFRRRMSGWRLTIQEIGRLGAPLLGAGLFVLVGGGAVAAMDAATFVLAALVITRLRTPDAPPAGERERVGQALQAGVRHVFATPQIRSVMIAATAVMALSGVGVAAQYSLVSGVGQRPAFLGVFSAVLGAGSIIASLTARRIIDRFGERWLAVGGLINFAAGNLLRANHWLPATVAGTVVLGFALPYVFLATLNIAQRETPNQLRGRVSAALLFALFGPQALTQIIGSALIAHVTYTEIYAGSAAATVPIAIWLARRGDVAIGRAARRPACAR